MSPDEVQTKQQYNHERRNKVAFNLAIAEFNQVLCNLPPGTKSYVFNFSTYNVPYAVWRDIQEYYVNSGWKTSLSTVNERLIVSAT